MPRVGKLVLLVVVLALILVIAGFFFVRRRNQLAALTAEAPAQVLSVSVDTDRTRSNNNRSRTRHKTNISYRYTVNGTALNGKTSKSGDVKSSYENGQAVKVCYEPAHPENSEIFTADYKCGG